MTIDQYKCKLLSKDAVAHKIENLILTLNNLKPHTRSNTG